MNRCPITYATLADRDQIYLRAGLRIREGRFEVVDHGGRYILKPQSRDYFHQPENEDLTMRLARVVGIETPLHGLVRSRDGSWTYFIRRFDRQPRGPRLAVEDFAQLSGRTRETKYDASMEQVVRVIDRFTTYPVVEKLELLRRTLFCFLTGGEDMHLKNWSLITRGDLLEYFARDRLELRQAAIDDLLLTLRDVRPKWEDLITAAFLPPRLKDAYRDVLGQRWERLFS